MTTITEILGLAADATADQIIEAARALKDRVTTLQNNVGSQSSEIATLTNTIATHTSQLTTAQSQFAAERSARIELPLANALEKGRITLAQRDHWKTELEKDLAAAETSLANQAPALNPESKTRDLGNQKNAYDTAAGRQAALIAYIGEQMANGLNYDDAWAKAKLERADIFANMRNK